MRFLRLGPGLFAAVLLAALLLAAAGWLRDRQGEWPWSPLDLRRPTGPFTAGRIVRLGSDRTGCLALLGRAGVRVTPLPPRRDGPNCGYTDVVRLRDGGSRDLAYAPPAAVSCRVAAALFLWERDVVQPAARRRFGRRVARIDSFGSYNCRRIGGGGEGNWSEHARANAIDIAGFRLADGHRVTVAADWAGHGAEASFLQDVRDGACRIFATVLSPDFNAAHHDHLHLDEADRAASWRTCR